MNLTQNKENAIAFYKMAFEGHPKQAVKQYLGDEYIQHNPDVVNGLDGFIDYFERMHHEYPDKSIEFVRCIAEGNLVALHTHQTWPGNDQYVTMDFFRFDANGKICEHWDAIQQIPLLQRIQIRCINESLMKALIYEKFQGPLTIQRVLDPSPTNHGVVVRVTATGLCRSDWHGWMGHDSDIDLPHIPGHELAGIIEAKGSDVKSFEVGDRVTVPFVSGCGSCLQCHSGNQQVCDHQSQPGFTHWGSFAEYVALDYADINLVKIPEVISDKTAAILGCRFITSFRAVVDQGKVSGGQWVAVHGCGGVGLSAIMIASALGAQVIAIDIDDETLKLSKSLGASHTVNAAKIADIPEYIKSISQGGVHVSVDALGSQATCFNSVANLRKRGKHIQVGLMTGDHQHPKIPMDRVLADELEIIGSHGMQAHRYPEMLEMIKCGKLQPELLIERTIALEEAATALPNMDQFKHAGVLIIDSF